MILMFAPATLNLVLVINPATQGLLFKNFQPFTYMDVSTASYEYGSWYPPLYFWAMVQMISAYVISAIAYAKNSGYRRRQVLILNLGVTAALIQNILGHSFSKAMEVEWIISNTFILLVTQIGIMYALIYHRLLNVVPLAMARIFKQLSDPVFVLDDENRVMGVNEKGISFFGLNDDYLGQRFDKLLPTVALVPGEVIYQNHHFHVALEKITEKSEDSSGTVVTFRDISSQKSAELRLLEGIDFRTRLLALMAHDLSGFVDTQAMIAQNMQKKVTEGHSEHLDHLETLSLASQSLISNVMNWTKNDSMKFDVAKKSFEWNALIRDVIEQVQGRLEMKEIEVVFEHVPDFVLTNGDSEMMASVLRNIVFNSLRATPRKKKIYITLVRTTSAVEIKVRDEGDGIAPDELKRIIAASKDFTIIGLSKTHGSGIGLMLARYFISLHGGSFSMESRLGVGTEVVFSVPL